ncbi:hypothetical protein BCR33DRAFT_839479 [Rhizoclosmatium globosum]|uniref:Uncharacterized protein n=1 Tax=Rhizoclosmatium globosum TaxID=329046 RepID=A0A1Y2AN51_9FUNG|nr:hypothetical protein BCR33DRAFT_748236 [Rhizoclosmatium globosum]ORY36757.1 hypothetical protein BCR33DRAFT_742695 [Rhizoclosmatium globosum]ORY50602.1 hypothetical protein BCR33DRAFT_839479 [Rhizoclosmatium globosum]|eukprot:ORY23914.1 hypothetical protein BCR33DRAFT_748236 [Rhizoclosmatium globosum]
MQNIDAQDSIKSTQLISSPSKQAHTPDSDSEEEEDFSDDTLEEEVSPFVWSYDCAHPLKDCKTPEYLENNASFPPSQKPCPERRKTHKNLVQTILKYKVFSSNCTLADIKRRKLLIGQKPPPFVNDIANYIDLSEGGNVFTTDGHLLLSVMPSFLDHVYYTKDSATQTYGRGFFQLGNQVYHAESVALGALIALAGSFKKLPQPNDIRHDGYARFGGVLHLGLRFPRGHYFAEKYDGGIVPSADCSSSYSRKAYSAYQRSMAPIQQAIGLLYSLLAPKAYERDQKIVNFYSRATGLIEAISCSRTTKLMVAIPICDNVTVHFDGKDDGHNDTLAPMTVFGYFEGGWLVFPGLMVKVKYVSGTYVLTRPHFLEHCITEITGPKMFDVNHPIVQLFHSRNQSRDKWIKNYWTMTETELKEKGLRFGLVHYNEKLAATHATKK